MDKEGLSQDQLLFAFGFISDDEARKEYGGKSNEERLQLVKEGKVTKEQCQKWASNHEIEEAKNQLMKTGFPEPGWFHYIVYESYQASLEESYYWLLNYLRYDAGFPQVFKVTDVFAASEHSSFFGSSEQRVGIQQDRISNFLATIGKLTKEVFQIVRELRILDERLDMYKASNDANRKDRESAEISLKGTWIDLVEGGTKNAGSVFGLARELQFTTLPDLFFAIHPPKPEDVDEYVDKQDEFNRKVREVLKRKLRSYLHWKERTLQEISWRRNFTLKYLRQHYLVIRLYMQWVRPYMRHLKRLNSNLERMDRADLVSAFESSMMEVEMLARQMPKNNKEVYAVEIINMRFRTRPSMSYVQEGGGYQRGPIHVGEVRIQYRTYAWDEKEITNYLKMREIEDWELMLGIDETILQSMTELGGDLRKYLEEAGEVFENKVKAETPRKPEGMLSPFTGVLKGFGEIFTAFGGNEKKEEKKEGAKDETLMGRMMSSVSKESKSKMNKYAKDQERGRAKEQAMFMAWLSYKNYKAGHRMLTW